MKMPILLCTWAEEQFQPALKAGAIRPTSKAAHKQLAGQFPGANTASNFTTKEKFSDTRFLARDLCLRMAAEVI